METGGVYVMLGGEQLMLMLPADNLVTLAQVGDNSIVAASYLAPYKWPSFGRCDCIQQCTLWTKC